MSRNRIVLCVLALSAMMTASVFAGAKDDLSRYRSSYDSGYKSRVEERVRGIEDFLKSSRELRSFDKAELNELINQICRLDIEASDDPPSRLAQSMADKAVDRVSRKYDETYKKGEKEDYELKKVTADLKLLDNEVGKLTSDAEVKDDASRLSGEIRAAIEKCDRLQRDLDADYRSLTNVRDGVMKGANNPMIRAKMEYGKEKHLYNQRICDEKEVSLSSGRPDCISFLPDNCIVWEFKPDTYSESAATAEARDYVRDVAEKYKNDDRAKKNCKKESDGVTPIFTPKGQLYPACRPD